MITTKQDKSTMQQLFE